MIEKTGALRKTNINRKTKKILSIFGKQRNKVKYLTRNPIQLTFVKNACQTLSKALHIKRVTSREALRMLIILGILSMATVRGSTAE